MKHVISTNTLISFLVACSLNIVFTIAMVMSYYPLDEDAAGSFCVFGLICSLWVVIATVYIIYKCKRYEKEAKEDRRQAQDEILRFLDEKGAMSKEELILHPEYQRRIGQYVGNHYWCPAILFRVGRKDYPIVKEVVISMGEWDEAVRDDLEFLLNSMARDGLLEEIIGDKYQRSQQSVKAFIAACCERDAYAETDCHELYDAYCTYCEDNGMTPVYFSFFVDEVCAETFARLVCPSRYFIGIKIKRS